MNDHISTRLTPTDALPVDEIPTGDGWQYEPKWDGFRCLAFRNGNEVKLCSKSGRPLGRYFPELVAALAAVKANRFVLDGEIILPAGRNVSFDQLLMRIHPAGSRIQKLARETPAQFQVFDLLGDLKAKSLLMLPLKERRQRLELFAAAAFKGMGQLCLSPATTDVKIARKWFSAAGRAFDGLIAKRLDAEYRPGERTAMQKVKPRHTADCVVGGFRYAEKKREVGSLLLGLYDQKRLLNHVGFCSGIKAAERAVLTKKLEKLVKPPGFTGQRPGGPSRWSTKRTAQWLPLRASLVVEVEFDHVTGQRFRHGTKFIRWRPDKKPANCLMDQLHGKTIPANAYHLMKKRQINKAVDRRFAMRNQRAPLNPDDHGKKGLTDVPDVVRPPRERKGVRRQQLGRTLNQSELATRDPARPVAKTARSRKKEGSPKKGADKQSGRQQHRQRGLGKNQGNQGVRGPNPQQANAAPRQRGQSTRARVSLKSRTKNRSGSQSNRDGK